MLSERKESRITPGLWSEELDGWNGHLIGLRVRHGKHEVTAEGMPFFPLTWTSGVEVSRLQHCFYPVMLLQGREGFRGWAG